MTMLQSISLVISGTSESNCGSTTKIRAYIDSLGQVQIIHFPEGHQVRYY